jgi:hypothetical protein
METGKGLRCPRCHAAVLDDVTAEAVVTVEGEWLPFRRNTDYVMCSCLATWRVTDLQHARAQFEAKTRS